MYLTRWHAPCLWRRATTSTGVANGEKAVSTAMKPTDTTSTPSKDLNDLVNRAANGDSSALQRILQDPKSVDAVGGDLAKQVELSFVAAIASTDTVFKATLTRKMELLRAEL